MRVTIDHREALSVFGRKHFFVDCTVLFSEAERAIIKNRQLGDHAIVVDGDTPVFRSIAAYKIRIVALTFVFLLSAVCIIPALVVIPMLELNSGWWLLLVMLCGGTWGYRRYLEKQYKKSNEERHVSLSQMLKNSKFTVYAPDAYLAGEAEKSIVGQINELKDRMVAIAPGLAEKQVYAREP